MGRADLIILISALGAGLFVFLRVVTLPSWWKLLTARLNVSAGFNFKESWASNITLGSASLGVILQQVGGKAPDDLTSLNFLFALMLALSALTYLSGAGRVAIFLFADTLALWSVIGATSGLWVAIQQIAWFSTLARTIAVVILPLSLVGVAVYAWRAMGALLSNVRAEMESAGAAAIAESEPPRVEWTLR